MTQTQQDLLARYFHSENNLRRAEEILKRRLPKHTTHIRPEDKGIYDTLVKAGLVEVVNDFYVRKR